MPRKPTCECGDCRKCKNRAYMKAWYRRQSPEKRRDIVASRDPAIGMRVDQKRRTTEEQTIKHRAHNAVYRAIKRGDLVRQECERFGPTCFGRVEAHHNDYSKPLEVRWLCCGHHAEERV